MKSFFGLLALVDEKNYSKNEQIVKQRKEKKKVAKFPKREGL
jgi:hypothetical protein